MSLNKVITSVNALVNSVSIPKEQLNNVVCIDTENNRIGVKTANPTKEIDVNGTIQTNNLYLNNENNINDLDLDYDKNYLTFRKGIKVLGDILINGNVESENLYINSDVLFQRNLDVNNLLTATNLKVLGDASFNENVNITDSLTVLGDVSFSGFKSNVITKEISIKDLKVLNDLNVDKDLTVSKNLIVIENTNVKNLEVDETLTAQTFSYSTSKTTSDDRYKHNEKYIDNGLNIIRQLEPQIYQKTSTFKDENFIGNVDEPYFIEAGLIAQEVNMINDISFVVSIGNEIKPYYLNYNNIHIYTLAGLKELDKIVSNNIYDISNLSNRLSNISQGTPDILDVNLSNIKNLIINQNTLIQALNNKISNLETRINELENK